MADGPLHVRSYTQTRDGKTVAVAVHDRSSPATIKPIPQIAIRKDDAGDGKYGASRRNADKTWRPHLGVDLLSEPGAPVASPIDGAIDIGPAYKDPKKGEYLIVTVLSGNDRYRFFYVSPNDKGGQPIVNKNDRVKQGQTIGIVQDIAKSDGAGKMRNHIHFEQWKNGKPIDPTPQVTEWQKD